MKNRMIKTLVVAISCAIASVSVFTGIANAQIRYQANISPEAKKLWTTDSNRLKCSLLFSVPDYGIVNFMTYSGKTLRSNMTVHPKLGIADDSVMRFIATKPEWQSVSNEKLLGKIKLFPGFNPYVGPTLSWKILSELSHGNQILMPYTDKKLAAGQNIIPTLSPLGFKKAYRDYLSCQEQLIRVNFNDIRMMPLVFKLREHNLTEKSLNLLNEQLEYLKLDKNITKITIRAYAYDMSKGPDNVSLAKDRAEMLKKAYTDIGISEDLIEIVPFNALTLNTKAENPIVDESVKSRNALITVDRDNALINKDLEANTPDVGTDVM